VWDKYNKQPISNEIEIIVIIKIRKIKRKTHSPQELIRSIGMDNSILYAGAGVQSLNTSLIHLMSEFLNY
jgi:hypothetical protein